MVGRSCTLHTRPCHQNMFHKSYLSRKISLILIVIISLKRFTNATFPPPNPTISWDKFTFGLNNVTTSHMWLDQTPTSHPRYSTSASSSLTSLKPLTLHPASTVLNYGQSLFEGLKAFRRIDGTVAIFRPERNALRLAAGARRLLLPPVPTEAFLTACDAVVRSNAEWIPPQGRGALYLRPLLFGSGAGLGVKPSTDSTFCVYASPVGNYFGAGEPKAITLRASRQWSRAHARGGSGNVKAGGNYAPCFLRQKIVRESGYDEALFLDVATGEAVEEAGASNFFAVLGEGKTLVTPSLDDGTILPGITRDSILELARQELPGCEVVERRLTLRDLEQASEAFCCGTGASVTPVGKVNIVEGETEQGRDILFGDGKSAGPITKKLYGLLMDIQMGTGEDKELHRKYAKWIHVVDEE